MIANEERSFWGINQLDCEKVIDNTCSFFVSRSRLRTEKNIFFDADIVVKNKSNVASRSLYSYRQFRQNLF